VIARGAMLKTGPLREPWGAPANCRSQKEGLRAEHLSAGGNPGIMHSFVWADAMARKTFGSIVSRTLEQGCIRE
jgi:hypothetical protein